MLTLAWLSWPAWPADMNTPKHFQTCHKIVPYKTVDIKQNSYFMIDKYPKFYNKYIIQNKYEYYDE